MNNHPYLRAYLAGIFAPSLFLLVALTAFVVSRLVFHVPIPIERALIFPMALVPNVFGLWNVFYLWLRPRPHLPIGFHGALLPIIMAPAGRGPGLLARIPEHRHSRHHLVRSSSRHPYALIVPAFIAGLVLYYLVWKYIVGFLNQVLGIA